MTPRALTLTLLVSAGAWAEVPELSPPSTGRAAPNDAAVVVGVDQYAALPAVAYADRDAEAFADFLRDTVGVPRSRVKVLVGIYATGPAMRREVKRAASDVGPGGTLWVYFSGHGAPAKDDAWLMGHSVVPEPDYLAEGAFSRKELTRLAGGVRPGARAVVILDACFSGRDRAGAAVSKLRFSVPSTLAAVPRVAVWSATQATEYAGPLPAAEQGLFTYFVVGALSGWADANSDGSVALREAERYVGKAMGRVLERAGRTQRPGLTAVDGADGWVLSTLGGSALAAPEVDEGWLAVAGAASASGGGVGPGIALDRGDDIQNIVVEDTGFLTVQTQPPGARITINGSDVGGAPVQREQMVGRYVVVADHGALFHPARQALTLGLEGATVELKLLPRFGTLNVTSAPLGAEVWIEGEQVGVTPWNDAQRRSGAYALRVVRPLYLVFEQSVTVRDGETTAVVAALSANFGRLRVETDPPGASIRLDGAATPHKTPYVFEQVQVGAHTLEFERAGHGRVATRATVERGKETVARVSLDAKLGLLSVLATDGAALPCAGRVHVDGEPRGDTPVKIQLVEGRHRIQVACGAAIGEIDVDVLHNQKATLTVATSVPGKAGVEWVRVMGGSFEMGSDDWSSEDDEEPVRTVRVPTFELAKTEVTVAQYQACVNDGACTPPHWDDGSCYSIEWNGWGKARLPAALRPDDHPVVCVDWAQATAFSRWVGGRLPTEAEWEYAARSRGKDQEYPWGDDSPSCELTVKNEGPGWQSGSKLTDGLGCGTKATFAVCSKPAGNSAQGVCDLAGNVSEWVADWHGTYADAPIDGRGRTKGHTFRVYRGGSWTDKSSVHRAARRQGKNPRQTGSEVGFRPARSTGPRPAVGDSP